MKVGDKVKPVRFPSGPAGEVKHMDGSDVAVQFVMGRGWKHVAWFELGELEVEK